MWLLRGLAFTCKALLAAQANKAEELSAAFTKSYEGTLKKFHNFVVKGIFAVSLPIWPSPSLIRVGAIVFLQSPSYSSLQCPCEVVPT